ncbi:Gfo/Idh/MocA family protein [Nocardioides hankookensis]|uniref:Gfo/Idh/MocA family protein n=1 Tax=Nocardioides hankookensis TaxID=443157 RepID=A0ABW1LRQ6_9ACTN
MIGHAFMGKAHSQAWRTAARMFELPVEPVMAVLCGQDIGRATAAAVQLGWAEAADDWRSVIARDDIDLVDICTPGDSHAEIAIAALEACKHVICEKPLANSTLEAEAMANAAAQAHATGARAMVGFTYRRVPAVALARQLIANGRVGDVRHVRAQYLQDWIADPEAPMNWRLEKDRAGSGALGDIGAHIVDLTQYLLDDQIAQVTADLRTFVKDRPIAGTGDALIPDRRGLVTVDDAAAFIATFAGGALGVFEATRFATGRKNAIRIEINGSCGSLAFDFEDMNVLHFYDATEPAATAGFRRILATEPEHPYVEAWWPAGHGLGYEHGFTHQIVDFVNAVAAGTDPTPTFVDGLHVQHVLDTIERSAEARSWQPVAP